MFPPNFIRVSTYFVLAVMRAGVVSGAATGAAPSCRPRGWVAGSTAMDTVCVLSGMFSERCIHDKPRLSPESRGSKWIEHPVA